MIGKKNSKVRNGSEWFGKIRNGSRWVVLTIKGRRKGFFLHCEKKPVWGVWQRVVRVRAHIGG